MLFDYPDYLNRLCRGDRVPSRHGDTFELLNQVVTVPAGVVPMRPSLNWKLAIMEGMQLIAGYFDLDQIRLVAPNAALHLFTPQGAYGPRARLALAYCIADLNDNPRSRQAVIRISDFNDLFSENPPCTNNLQFLLRDFRLHLIASMRSSDAIKGLPYDLAQFGLLAQAMASTLNVLPGLVTIQIGSAHIYESDLAKIPTAVRHRKIIYRSAEPHSVELTLATRWALARADATETATALAKGQVPDQVTMTEEVG